MSITTPSTDVIVPHLAFPLTMQVQPDGTLAAQVNEQDSLDDIVACVRALVVCPTGAWLDTPSFGIPNPLFAQAPVSTSGINQAIGRWEPRAATVIEEYPDLLSDATRLVQVNVSAAQPDQ